MWMSAGKASWAEGAARAKSLRQDHAWGPWGCGSETGEMRTDENFNLLVLSFIEKETQQVLLMTLDVFIISCLRCEFHTYCLSAGASVRRESSQTSPTKPLLLLGSVTQGLLG